MRRSLGLVTMLLLLAQASAAGPNYYHKVALHVVPHGIACKTLPTFTSCSDITSTFAGTGDIDVVPVFFDLKGCFLTEFGLTWPAQWGTCAYASCIDGISVGEIRAPGDAIATAWPDCRNDWAIAPGYAWLHASGPGIVALVPSPKTHWIGVVDCRAPSVRGYDWPAAIFSAGVGGTPGENPCEALEQPVTLQLENALHGACVDPGDTLIYRITYDNSTNQSQVKNAILIFETDTGRTEFVSASAGMKRDAANGEIVWPIGTIAPGERGSREVVLRVSASAEATVTGSCRLAGDRTPLSADTVSASICSRALKLLDLAASTSLSDSCARSGARFTWTLAYRNPNAAAVHGASLTCQLSNGAEFVSASSGGAYDSKSQSVTWRLGDIPSAGSDSAKVVVKAKGSRGAILEGACRLRADEPVERSVKATIHICGETPRNPGVKIAIHVRPHSSQLAKPPTFNSSREIASACASSGEIDFVPVFFDLKEYRRLEFGLDWPVEWGSCQFIVSGGDIRAGQIAKSGDGLAIGWGSCQHSWSFSPGYGWINATGPGRICPVPNPLSKRLGATNCSAPEPALDTAAKVFCAGVGGAAGDKP